MTVSSTTNTVIFTGDGSVTEFDFTFRIFLQTDLVCKKYTIADGTEETLALTTDYTVSIDGEDGGTVTTVATLSSAYKLIIQRVLPLTQTSDYVANDPFPAETHETVADRGVMLSQQLKEPLDRSVKIDATQTGVDVTLPAPEASKVIGWNSAADALENYDNAADSSIAAAASAAAALVSETNAGTSETNAATSAASVVIYGTVVALTDGATPALDAELGGVFTLAAGGDRTIGIPTNPTNGQRIIIRHTATGGARTLALNAGAGGFRFGTTVTALTETTSGATDYIGAIYNVTDTFWDVVAYSKGIA